MMQAAVAADVAAVVAEIKLIKYCPKNSNSDGIFFALTREINTFVKLYIISVHIYILRNNVTKNE